MATGKITRVSIFVDYDNFANAYCEKYQIDETAIPVWDGLNNAMLAYYKENFVNHDHEVIDHTGTFLCVGMSDYLAFKEEREIKKRFQALDRKRGFIVSYGNRTSPYRDKHGNFRLGKEKGVDAEIICQMLMGAFLNHYDSCILLSDDSDYLPVLRRLHEYFGKKVIQAGFRDSKLRNQSYGNIPLENADANLRFLRGPPDKDRGSKV